MISLQQLLMLWNILLASRNSLVLAKDADDSKFACTHRFEYRKEYKEKYFNGCENVIKSDPICGENITVAFSDFPPYVFRDHGGKVTGILPGMIDFALESCCFGCTSVTYVGPMEHMGRIFTNATQLSIPIETSEDSDKYFESDYVSMLQVRAINFFGPKVKHNPTKMGRNMIEAITNTWPLFLTALIMAVTAGVCIWILDSRWNESDFPSTFPRGPFEGFWWAFVSMTTVGYGDRSPKSIVARLFAMMWILIGITVFSMYTATLSSALTNAVIASHKVTVYQRKMAVLNTSAVSVKAAIQENSIGVGFESLHEISKALLEGKVEGFVLDNNMANFYMIELAEKGITDLILYHRLIMSGSAYGMVSRSKPLTQFFHSFYDSNNDQRDIMGALAMEGHSHAAKLATNKIDKFFSSDSPLFLYTIVSLLAIATITTTFGLAVKWIWLKIQSSEVFQDYFPQSNKDETIGLDTSDDSNYIQLLESVEEIQRKLKRMKENQTENGVHG